MNVRHLTKQSFKTDMPLWLLALLALLAVPRVVVHDLRSLPFDSPLYLMLAVTPFIIYLLVAVMRPSRRPFYDFIVMGIFFGLFLALTHQLLWDQAWGGNHPQLGDNLQNSLNPATETLGFRLAVLHSSVWVGVAIGAVFGTIAVIARKVRQRL